MYNSKRHFKAAYDSVQPEFAFNAKTRPALLAWQRRFRPRLRQALGLDAMESDLADFLSSFAKKPRAVRRSIEVCDGFTREFWHLWVEPTVPLPFYLLRPEKSARRLPLILTPHGHNHPDLYAGIAHTDEMRRMIIEGDRDIAVQAAREGYLAIAPTTRGFGETCTEADKEQDKPCSCMALQKHALMIGRTSIGQRVWDLERLLDWALAALPVDRKRIGITGNSSGGNASLFTAACNTRITVAVPSCYFCTFRDSIGTIFQHCDCNYIPGLLRLGEEHDVAGLIAPRPFRAVAGKTDGGFPIRHVREAFRKLQRIYKVAGVPERCSLYVGNGGHRYYKAGVWAFVRKAFAEA